MDPSETTSTGAGPGEDDPSRTVDYRPAGPPPPDADRPGRPWDGWGPGLGSFARGLVNLDVVGEAELAAAIGRLAATPADAEGLARELVRAGVLTGYQAGALLQGKARGLVLGNYVVLDRLGAGGGGMVLKVRHRKLGRVVALKVLPPSVQGDPTVVARFEREVRLVARLQHPNVVAAFDADEFQGLHFLVMEYVEGRDLAAMVAASGPPPLEKALDLMIQAGRGLRAAHDRGIVHRDIKPSNLMVDASGTVKVLDLGLARVRDDDSLAQAGPAAAPITMAGTTMGTVDFMAPEQAYDSQAADERSDIYSLGCTLYFLRAGRPPYVAPTFVQRVLAHREQPVPSLPDGPPALDALARRMMAKSPDDRPQSMAEVIAGLESIRDGAEHDARPPGPRPEPTPSPRRRRARGALLGALALVVGGLALVVALVLTFRPPRADGVATAPAGPRPPEPPPAPTAVAVAPEPKQPVPVPEPRPKPEPAPPPRPAPEALGEVGRLEGHSSPRVECVAASADGRFALSGGLDGTVRLWEIAARKEVFAGPNDGPAYAVAFLPDGRRGISAGEDGRVRIWELDTRRGPRVLPGQGGRIHAGATAGDGPGPGVLGLTGDEDGAVVVWDLAAGVEARRLDQGAPVAAVAFLPGGRQALSGGKDHSVRLWDLVARSEARRLDAGFRVLCLAATPDGRRVLAGGHGGALVVWDPAAGGVVRLEGHTSWVMGAASLPGDRAVSVDLAGALIVWDLKAGRELARFRSAGAGHRGLAVLPDGRHLLTADDDGLVRIWNLSADPPEAR